MKKLIEARKTPTQAHPSVKPRQQSGLARPKRIESIGGGDADQAGPARANSSDLRTAKSLGEIARALRARSGLTLKALATRTGMALSTLSKVENDQMSLTYDKLVQLAGGLGVDVAELFDGERRLAPQSSIGLGRRSINRLGEGKGVHTSNYSYLYLSTDLSKRELIPMVVEVNATSPDQFSDSPHHPGEEFAYVLEGELELHTEFYEPLVLKAGESISYDSGMRHAYVATVSPCRVLVVGSKPPRAEPA